MNQQCKVCGEPAAGFHFGAFTCEGCKSFFGRTYNNLSSISECKNNGGCVINKKNRTSCKACRLRKCLMVGMSKSGSRYGRRSNWFKIHCLLQEQQQQSQQHQQYQQQHQQNKNMFFPPNGLYPQEAFFNSHLLGPGPPRKSEDTSSEGSATSPHPQTPPAFFPNPALFLPSRFAPDALLHSRKRKQTAGDTSSEDSAHSPLYHNLPSPHTHTPPMFFPNPALYLPSRFPPDPLLKRSFDDNSSEDSSPTSKNNNNNNNNNNKLPLGFYPNPNMFLPSRVTPETLVNNKKLKQDDDSSSSASNASSGGEETDVSRPQSVRGSPSSDKEVFQRKLSATVMLTSSTTMFTPKRFLLPPSVTKPGLTPSHGGGPFLGETCATSARSGGDLLVCSPALGGVALEQEQPIDLSVKSTPPVDDSTSLEIEEGSKRGCKDGVLDLTNKRTADVMI